jgi:hypothetical protein
MHEAGFFWLKPEAKVTVMTCIILNEPMMSVQPKPTPINCQKVTLKHGVSTPFKKTAQQHNSPAPARQCLLIVWHGSLLTTAAPKS